MGAHLKKQGRTRPGLLIGGSTMGLLGIISLFKPFQFDKFWMSPEYFLIGCAVAAGSFAGVRRLTGTCGQRLFEIRRWGANSLVFYMANNSIIRVLELVMPHGLTLFLLSLGLTALLLRPAVALQAWAGQRRPGSVLLAGVAIVFVLLAADRTLWVQEFSLHMLASLGLVPCFVASYPAWKSLSRALAKASREVSRENGPAALAVIWRY